MQWKLTGSFFYSLIYDVVLLMDPFTIALEVDLGGRAGFETFGFTGLFFTI